MLLQFSIRNFKSFVDETVFDLTATNIKEHRSSLLDFNGVKVLPVAAFFGANASGKSNFFLAFSILRSLIMTDNQNKLTSIVPYYFNSQNISAPTEFQVCINIDDIEYRYGFECDKEEIKTEWLFKKPFLKGTRAKERMIFFREKEQVQYGNKLKVKELKELKYANEMALKNQLILNIIGKRDKSEYAKIHHWFVQSFNFNMADSHTETMLNDVNIAFLYDNPHIKGPVSNLISTVDPSILGIDIETFKDENLNDSYKCISIHKTDSGEEIRVPFDIESSGTKKILCLAVGIYLTLTAGRAYFVDELDAKLHPLLLRYIIQMYTNPEINKNNAQLIFSAHNIVCLDSSDLRRDEIWFVEKNDQKSEIFSLYDFKLDEANVRSDLSFGKHYLAGRFGAVPFADEVL